MDTNTRKRTLIQEALASFVVFLVALPLSMGIAIACGLSPTQGLLTGIIGGIVVGLISGSPLQVSGASASLTIFVCDFIAERGLGLFGPVILMAGLIQIGFGVMGLGRYFRMVSPAVLHGILAGVGLLIAASQFHVMFDLRPHSSALDSIVSVPASLSAVQEPGSQARAAIIIAVVSLAIMLAWRGLRLDKRLIIPGGLPAIIVAALLTWYFALDINMVAVPHSLGQAVQIPTLASFFQAFGDKTVICLALELALIASTETMLSAAAVDQMHNGKRSQFNQELMAQGGGNMLCGLVGALPLTGAIVRSSVNVEAGARSRLSTIMHGLWILLVVFFLPGLLEMVPVAALAALLVFTGLRLVDIGVMRQLWRFGWVELAIFLVTAFAVVVGSLLTGIIVGLICAAIKTFYRLCQADISLSEGENGEYVLKLSGSLVFLNLPELSDLLSTVPEGARLHVHFDHLNHIDHACLEELRRWEERHMQTEGRLVVEWEELLGRHHKPLFMLRPVWQPPANGAEMVMPQPLEVKMPAGSEIWKQHADNAACADDGNCLQQLIRGANHFSSTVFPQMAGTFKSLETMQKPHTLFITCSDSRVIPDLITLSGPGNIFTVRNPGCIIPPVEAAPTSEAASIEFAVDILGVKHIVICGHSDCGAVKCLCCPPPGLQEQRPALGSWLSQAGHGEADPELLLKEPGESALEYAIKLHVLKQVEKIKRYRHVEPLVASGALDLTAWYYNIANGSIWAYNPGTKRFERPTLKNIVETPAA